MVRLYHAPILLFNSFAAGADATFFLPQIEMVIAWPGMLHAVHTRKLQTLARSLCLCS